MHQGTHERLTLTVVTTTRNNAATIQRCLDSLMPWYRQGYITEIAVVDGQSHDGTAEIAQRYPVNLLSKCDEEYKNSFIRGWRDIHSGLEIGWRSSSSDLVMFLDCDAYLGESFFPQASEFFTDRALGVLGCWPKAWVTTPLTKTMGELWFFHGERIRSIQSGSVVRRPFELLYALVTTFRAKRPYTSGPCYIVRRSCLELLEGHDVFTSDAGISPRLEDKGWHSQWWVDAPVYHLPKETLRGLLRQRYFWGKGLACRSVGVRPALLFPLRMGGAIALGALLAARFRNPLQLVTLPLAEVGYLAGYVAGQWARARGKD